MDSDRMFWGIKFVSHDRPDLLLFGGWHEAMRFPSYPGEPTRPILFTSLRLARDWCRQQHAEYRHRTDSCRHWRFRPVRVRERLTVEDR